MESIDVHFHAVPPDLVEAIRRDVFPEVVQVERGPGPERLRSHAPPGVVLEPDITVGPELYDERRLVEALSRRGLDRAALSLPPELLFDWAPPAVGERIARVANDGLAALAGTHPDRFVGLGTLPVQDGERAARELERGVTQLGLRGFELCTHAGGRDLDHPAFAPVWAAAERLGVPFFLHPQNAGDVRRLADHALGNVVGFPTETALTAARLIFGGVFERHPGVRVILAHGGGYFPYQIGRLDHGWAVRAELAAQLPRRPSDYLASVYCDSLVHSEVALRFLLDRLGEDRVVIGSDHPFDMGDPSPVATIRRLGLGRARERKVLGANLAKLLGLA